MKKKFLVLLGVCLVSLLLMPVLVCAGTSWIELAWDANSETDLAGYRVYQSTMSGQYERVVDNPSTPYLAGEVDAATTGIVLTGLVDGTYYWVVTAFDTEGHESLYSNEVSETMDTETNLPPAPPGMLRKVDSGQDPY